MAQKILVVEDSRSFRQQLTITLESRGYKVITAENGADAIKKLREQPDITALISDVHMPEMNGITMMQTIRAQKLYTGPVMFLTTEGDYKIIREGREAGASCWLVKPFQPNTLLNALEKIIAAPKVSAAG